jgi:hypothetical protein
MNKEMEAKSRTRKALGGKYLGGTREVRKWKNMEADQ